MLDAPKPFWYLAGIALLIVAIPIGWRIANVNQAVTVDASGVSVTLAGVQQSISEAQESVTQFQQQAQAQSAEIGELETQLRADQNRISTLVAEVQSSQQVPASVKASARTIQEQQDRQIVPAVPTVDAALLVKAQGKLAEAHDLAAKLGNKR